LVSLHKHWVKWIKEALTADNWAPDFKDSLIKMWIRQYKERVVRILPSAGTLGVV
jgi:hypothetical protein